MIVPCYNAETTLQRAVNSVVAQTYRDFAIYAVDDGSTDRTPALLSAFTDRLSFVRQKHRGPAAARNRAILMSDSRFIAFLDADDEWLPLKLERQISLLKRDPSLGLVASFCAIKSCATGQTSTFAPADIPFSGNLFRQLARRCFVFTPTIVVRRHCLEEVGMFNESLAVSEDFNLWLRIAARWKIALFPEVLAIVHKRQDSLSGTVASDDRLRNGVAALEHVRSSYSKLSFADTSALHKAIAERMYFHGSFLLSSGAKSAARRRLASVLRYQPTHWKALAKLALSLLPVRNLSHLTELGRRNTATERAE